MTVDIIRTCHVLRLSDSWKEVSGWGRKYAVAFRYFASRIRATEFEKNDFKEQKSLRRNRYRLPKEERTVQSPYLPPTNGHEYKLYEHALREPEDVIRLTLRWIKEGEIDERIQNLSNLRYLYLSFWNLKVLPDVIGELTELRGLTLYSGFYRETTPLKIPALTQLKKLEYLNLWANYFVGLPDGIGELSNLRRLSFGSYVETVPEAIGNLRQLRYLGIVAGRLPETIGNLERLQILHVGSRKLNALPDSIRRLQELEKLSLGGVSMEELPDAISDLAALRVLNIGYSQIRRLPVSIGRLLNLQILNAYNYAQHRLDLSPEVIRQLARLPQLKKLVLPKENLADLPESLRGKAFPW